MSNNPQQEQALLHQLRSNGNPAAPQEAAQLQELYHDRQMGNLAADVYDAAKGPGKPPEGAGEPPAGWIRVSDDPGKYAAQLHMTKEELIDQLHPDKSGFRAEIYLSDPKILGPGYQPVVAFKGSSGDVVGGMLDASGQIVKSIARLAPAKPAGLAHTQCARECS